MRNDIFSRRDTAILLAGMRLLQQATAVPDAVKDILEDGDADDLTAEEIDFLCERINCG